MRPMEALLSQGQRMLYLATPPSAVMPIVTGLGQAGLAEGTTLVLEKPIGRDVASARALNESLGGARPVQPRRDRRRGGPRLPRGAGGRARLPDRDLRGDAAADRLLALGWHPL